MYFAYLSIKRCILLIGGMGWVLLWIWVWCRHCSDDCLLVHFEESTSGQEDTQSEVMSNFDTFIHEECLPEQYMGLSGKLRILCNIDIFPEYITIYITKYDDMPVLTIIAARKLFSFYI